MVAIAINAGDVLTTKADVLVLKHAQAPYGVDAAVLGAFASAGREVPLPGPWDFRLEETVPGVAASRILFIGVPPLYHFTYGEIRSFGRRALSALAAGYPQAQDVLLTVHGAGYGLDELEAFGAELAGLADAVREGEYPQGLRTITIVEINPGRAKRLADTLGYLLPSGLITPRGTLETRASPRAAEKLQTAGAGAKPHVFVAMPFREEMDDVYHYGIQSAVNAAGYLCERADLSSFTGDVVEWVRSRMRSASLVIADLSEANPNVYLEVGYAWGVGVPTVLVVRSTDQLKFDVQGQRCLVYKKIKDLEDLLTAELKGLQPTQNSSRQ